MSVSVEATLGFNIQETLETSVDGASSATIPFQDWVVNETLTGTTSNPVTKKYTVEHDMSTTSNLLDIDLTAFTATNGATDNANGLKVRGWKITNVSSSGNAVVQPAPSNDYELNDGDNITIEPGHTVAKWCPNGLAAITASTAENIRIAGIVTVRVEIVMG